MLSKYKVIVILVAVLAVCAGVHHFLLPATHGKALLDRPAAKAVDDGTGPQVPQSAADPRSMLMPPKADRPAAFASGKADSSLANAGFELFLYLGLILLIIGTCVFAIKKIFPASKRLFNSGAMEVVGRTWLAPKQFICLVRVGSRMLVLGCTQQSINVLCEIGDPAEVSAMKESLYRGSPNSATDTFRNIFRKKNLGYEESDLSATDPADPDRQRLKTVKSELGKLRSIVSAWKQDNA